MSKQSRFLQGLATLVASGSSVRAAAVEVGCSERQAYALATTAEFRETVSRLRTEMIQQAAAMLAHNATKAVQVLTELLASDDEKIRLAASTKLIATLHPMAELGELRERIEQLESSQALKVVR